MSLTMPRYCGIPIIGFLDPPHCQKLTRNTIGDLGALVDGNGGEVKWEHVKLLHELQTIEGHHLANKLKREHILYSKNKMKVRLATEVLSQSVATALLFCEDDLKLPQFRGARVTADFLSCFDILFDVMNSKYMFGKGTKAAICSANFQEISTFFYQCRRYIQSLRHTNGGLVVEGRRKAAFVGWIFNMKSLDIMFTQYVCSG